MNQLLKSLPKRLDSDGFEIFSPTDKGKDRASNQEAVEDVGKWLSDWHLIAFLHTTGIFEDADMDTVAKIATVRNSSLTDTFLRSSGWRTLSQIALEQSGQSPYHSLEVQWQRADKLSSSSSSKAETSEAQTTATAGSSVRSEVQEFEYDAEGFPIIPSDHDMMQTDARTRPPSSAANPIDIDTPPAPLRDIDSQGAQQDANGGGGGNVGPLVCPHCTFENAPGTIDCEICSLPL